MEEDLQPIERCNNPVCLGGRLMISAEGLQLWEKCFDCGKTWLVGWTGPHYYSIYSRRAGVAFRGNQEYKSRG